MKASRVKPAISDDKKPGGSGRMRWFVIVVKDSLRSVFGDAFRFILILALAGGGWYLYRNFHGSPVSAPAQMPAKVSLGIESEFSELIGALEKYHTDKGVYPKKLRDAYNPQNKPILGLMYRGTGRELVLTEACAADPFSDPCWTGYKKFELAAEREGKAYIYSSESKTWYNQKS